LSPSKVAKSEEGLRQHDESKPATSDPGIDLPAKAVPHPKVELVEPDSKAARPRRASARGLTRISFSSDACEMNTSNSRLSVDGS